jgi:DNA-binding MarR family transcriptional regulator
MLKSAESDRAQVLRCISFGRDSMDLLCDSLGLQCHQVRAALDELEDTGLVRARGPAGTASLEFTLTEDGRREALRRLDERERALAERGLAPDDVEFLRRLAGGGPPPRRVECEWGVGGTRQRLWQIGLIDVVGFLLPRVVLTERGRTVVDDVDGGAA